MKGDTRSSHEVGGCCQKCRLQESPRTAGLLKTGFVFYGETSTEVYSGVRGP